MNKIVSVIAACAAMAVALPGHAQTRYPSKPVRLLIPFPPGGPTDSAVRVFLPVLSQALGQEFSIVNMAGSHGALAPTALLKEPPDGHTLLVGNSSPLVAVPILRKDAPYDPVRDFAPVSLMGWTPLRAAFDYKSSTPQELGAFLGEQLKVWGTVAREAGLQAH